MTPSPSTPGRELLEDDAAFTRHMKAELKERATPRDGETRVRAKCSKCRRVLADLIGTADLGCRIEGNEPVRRIDDGHGGTVVVTVTSHDPKATSIASRRPSTIHVKDARDPATITPYDRSAGFQGLTDSLESGVPRGRFVCHPRCGANFAYLTSNLDAAFREAVAHHRPAIFLPEDLRAGR